MELQTKLLSTDSAAIKMVAADPHIISGYASVFGRVDSYGDTIKQGAYERTLQDRDRPVKMRWNHYGPVIGKWTRITEDEIGLRVEGELTPRHSVASDAAASISHGAVDGLSIGYYAVGYEQDDSQRTLTDIDLVEISIVEEPADLGARITGIKSLIEDVESLKQIEQILRSEVGLSRKDATALVSRIKKIARRDDAPITRGDRDIIASLIHNVTKRIAQ